MIFVLAFESLFEVFFVFLVLKQLIKIIISFLYVLVFKQLVKLIDILFFFEIIFTIFK